MSTPGVNHSALGHSSSLLFHIHGDTFAIKSGDSFSYGEKMTKKSVELVAWI